MLLLHMYTRDLGGEFDQVGVTDAIKPLGEQVFERATQVYSDYFVASGLAPVRLKLRQDQVRVHSIPATLATHLKVFAYGVVLFEYTIEVPVNTCNPAHLFSVTEIDHPQRGLVTFEQLFHEDFEHVQPVLARSLSMQYTPPDFTDHFHLFIDDRDQSTKEAKVILLAQTENRNRAQKAGVIRTLDLGAGKEKLHLMGNQGYFATTDEFWDIVNFLELARVQVFELKIYDYILDRTIESTYGFLDRLPEVDRIMPLSWLQKGMREQVRQSYKLTEIRMDLVDLVKDISNTSKVTEDPFFQELYKEYNEAFRVHEWFRSVTEKIDEIEDVQRLITDRIDISKSTALEVTVILLIAIEIVLPLFRMLFDYLVR